MAIITTEDPDGHLEASLIYEGRVSRQDIVHKLALYSSIQGDKPEHIAHLDAEIVAMMVQSISFLFRKGLSMAFITQRKWILHGFDCPTDAGRYGGSHAYFGGQQVRAEAGWSFTDKVDTSEYAIGNERNHVFSERSKREAYESSYTAAETPLNAKVSSMLTKGRKLVKEWQLDANPILQDSNDAQDLTAGRNVESEDDAHEDGGQLHSDGVDKSESHDIAYSLLSKEEKTLLLLAEARDCHELLVDLILRFLPGRTFLKCH